MSNPLVYTIDDDIDFNMMLKLALKPYDIEIVTHLNPEDFTKSVKERKPDLCILDLNLQRDGEGFQLLKAMRNVIGSELPIFIMSKRADRDDVLKAMECGATDFIPKPLDDKFLLLKLKSYLKGCKGLKDLEPHTVKIDQLDSEADIEVKFNVTRVGLEFIELSSHVMFNKNSIISINGNILNEVFGKEIMRFKVEDCRQNDDLTYTIVVEREYVAEEFFQLRRWLVSYHEAGLSE